MRTMIRNLAVLIGMPAVVLLAAACHKKATAPPPAPPPPPAAPAIPAPNVTLTAEPSDIQYGQSSTLSWSSQNATHLDLEPGVGKVQASGSSSATPQDSTTYALTATGPGGTQSATVRVSVAPPPPIEFSETGAYDPGIKDAYFDYDHATIRADAEQALAADARFLKLHSSIRIRIIGKCDERGSEEYNLGLGERRATAARNFLVEAGVSAERISTLSLGKNQPECSDHTEECRQQNRRAHIHFRSLSE